MAAEGIWPWFRLGAGGGDICGTTHPRVRAPMLCHAAPESTGISPQCHQPSYASPCHPPRTLPLLGGAGLTGNSMELVSLVAASTTSNPPALPQPRRLDTFSQHQQAPPPPPKAALSGLMGYQSDREFGAIANDGPALPQNPGPGSQWTWPL